MAVIINEFEVVQEPAGQQGALEQGDTQAGAQEAQSLSPADIERIVRHFEERRERVTAD